MFCILLVVGENHWQPSVENQTVLLGALPLTLVTHLLLLHQGWEMQPMLALLFRHTVFISSQWSAHLTSGAMPADVFCVN